ncbi:tigger transposable element-derived protein 6-like [Stegodyphus dumicola]|uniref:tigger transposable element-derived protein 6-like n=1 Tax=Stegodyphus dumicola TaxID=202533 RepID=UPI0015B15A46|nr:tigger transposable element-derived protein 6-like [Stegodyphus dumicola]
MSGTDKRKLSVIGKSIMPCCFKRLKMESLPVVHRANRNAWMTSELFKEWLKDWNTELQRQSREVLLLLDNCASHPHLDCLMNVQMEFLPPRTTALVQANGHGHHKKFESLKQLKKVC